MTDWLTDLARIWTAAYIRVAYLYPRKCLLNARIHGHASWFHSNCLVSKTLQLPFSNPRKRVRQLVSSKWVYMSHYDYVAYPYFICDIINNLRLLLFVYVYSSCKNVHNIRNLIRILQIRTGRLFHWNRILHAHMWEAHASCQALSARPNFHLTSHFVNLYEISYRGWL
jgi:hypothetical protein